MNIDKILEQAYERMEEQFDINTQAPHEKIYQTLAFAKNNLNSCVFAYVNYYMGIFEGLFHTLFLEEFDAYPTLEEQNFMRESFEQSKWKKFKDKVKEHALKDFKSDE